MKAVVFVHDQRMEIIIQRLRSAGIQVQEGRCEKDMEQIERMATTGLSNLKNEGIA